MARLLMDTGILEKTPGFVPKIYTARFDVWKRSVVADTGVQMDVEAHSFAHAVYRLLTEVSKTVGGDVELLELRLKSRASTESMSTVLSNGP